MATPASTGTPEAAPTDVIGAKDFAGIQRYANTYIETWRAGSLYQADCTGIGPVPGYERWTTQWRQPPGVSVDRSEVINYLVPQLEAGGWVVFESNPTGVFLYRGTKPRGHLIEDCNADGETDWILLSVFDRGDYEINLTLPQGSDPFEES